MKKLIFLGVSVLGMLSLTAFNSVNNDEYNEVLQGDEITAVINKNTSEKELEDLKDFFAENGIDLIVKKIEFNENNEITSLSLILQKGDAKSQYSSSSNTPISQIKLGYKDNQLFINNTGMFDIAAWRNQGGFSHPNIDIDSLMKKHSMVFDFNFDEDTDSLFFKGNFDISKFKDQIMKSFTFEQDEDGNFTFNGQPFASFQNSGSQKFRFIDNPDIEKLIIIDGKESDFETLDSLAKSNELAEVDFLKPETAISIYGDKAKDGAIIATTKK